MCDKQSLRPACAYAQSDQSLCLSLEYSMIVKLLTEHHLEFLSLTGGCTGSSESTLIKMPHCWKSHALAHLLFLCFLPTGVSSSPLKRTTNGYVAAFKETKSYGEAEKFCTDHLRAALFPVIHLEDIAYYHFDDTVDYWVKGNVGIYARKVSHLLPSWIQPLLT